MSRCRIIKRLSSDGHEKFVIQQKHLLFRWQWVDAWINSLAGAACQDSFDSYQEAVDNLCYFDGSKSVDIVIFEKN